MTKKIVMAAIILALALTGSCVAGTRNNQPETISGTIRVVGNEPFTHLILRTAAAQGGRNHENPDILITGPLEEELRRDFQGKAVTLLGTPCTPPVSRFTACFRPAKIIVE